jgi:hypothetical protein
MSQEFPPPLEVDLAEPGPTWSHGDEIEVGEGDAVTGMEIDSFGSGWVMYNTPQHHPSQWQTQWGDVEAWRNKDVVVWAAHHSKGFKLRQTLPLSIDPPNPKLRQRAVDDVKASQHTLRAAVMMRCTDRKPSAKAGRQERRPNFGRIKIACSVAGAHDFI